MVSEFQAGQMAGSTLNNLGGGVGADILWVVMRPAWGDGLATVRDEQPLDVSVLGLRLVLPPSGGLSTHHVILTARLNRSPKS
jgi:hypothetical protein